MRVRGTRIVVSKLMQNEIPNKMHSGHLGLVKCREHAQQLFWWPGLSQDLAVIVKKSLSAKAECTAISVVKSDYYSRISVTEDRG